MTERVKIDEATVAALVADQFPQWADLPITRVRPGGWDNRTFRLGADLLVRMPAAAHYLAQVEKEQTWLPRLAAQLPLPIPAPVAVGAPGEGYTFPWSICAWIEGETVAAAEDLDHVTLAQDLADFLLALHAIDPAGGPPAGPHNFHRGGDPAVYDGQTRAATETLGDQINGAAALALWDEALATRWDRPPVWIHGDVAPGNLLVRNGRLAAVIDFGTCGVGDPACDLAFAWTFLNEAARDTFRQRLGLDDATWLRGQAWALWKALIVVAGAPGVHTRERDLHLRVLRRLGVM
ncbi:MAG: aminoglycoside phosphotransferase family protein [Phenylobacterium sp.]|uniref:aminoglycoside phosphotransferase family protein n=1 Tax=Phenylobacterium sp. TaxID=1871053 RepID=UPI0027352855|nr:aminoglycoside phosphotransferase family protein [Phenylobacterium sp.]MDP1642513.1 aminoglycoside phosphotransferase family protein [Phenylobacterium sp.]MDP3115807.1 aminoglycoside phosphotransferase family protein [Phenylobacterium sp.]